MKFKPDKRKIKTTEVVGAPETKHEAGFFDIDSFYTAEDRAAIIERANSLAEKFKWDDYVMLTTEAILLDPSLRDEFQYPDHVLSVRNMNLKNTQEKEMWPSSLYFATQLCIIDPSFHKKNTYSEEEKDQIEKAMVEEGINRFAENYEFWLKKAIVMPDRVAQMQLPGSVAARTLETYLAQFFEGKQVKYRRAPNIRQIIDVLAALAVYDPDRLKEVDLDASFWGQVEEIMHRYREKGVYKDNFCDVGWKIRLVAAKSVEVNRDGEFVVQKQEPAMGSSQPLPTRATV